MKKLLMILLVVLMIAATTEQPKSEVNQESMKKIKTVILTEFNTVLLRGAVRGTSVSKAQSELAAVSKRLRKEEPVYLFLDTPGGSIMAGVKLIDFARSLPNKVITITGRAASMGFVIAQFLDDRYILPFGELMMHRAKIGIFGQINNGEFDTRSAHIKRVVTKLEKKMAQRIGMSLKKYREMVKDEVYADGEQALWRNFADEIVFVRCDDSLSGEYTDQVDTFFGSVWVTRSKCPTINKPLKVSFSEGFRALTKEKQEEFIKNDLDDVLNGKNVKKPNKPFDAEWISP